MQSETGFPSSHQLNSYVASESRLKLAARAVLSADAGLLVVIGTETARAENVLQDCIFGLEAKFLITWNLARRRFTFGSTLGLDGSVAASSNRFCDNHATFLSLTRTITSTAANLSHTGRRSEWIQWQT